MAIYFSSDTHYFHANIIKYCSRPFQSIEHMHSELISRWNKVVGPDDIGIFVGDLSAGLGGRKRELGEVIKSLNGKKIFVRGNHDHIEDEWYLQAGFLRVAESIVLGRVLVVHFPLEEAISRKLDRPEWSGIEHVVHGHVHRVGVPNYESHFNVAVDRNEYSPVASDVAIPASLLNEFTESVSRFIDVKQPWRISDAI